jgi:hypothetical protein
MNARRFEILSIALQLLLLVPGACLAQESQVETVVISGSDVKFPALSGDFIDRFFDSLKSKGGFVANPLVVSQVVDANTSGVWAGTKTEVETSVPEIVLRFRPTAEARLERASRTEQGGAGMLAEEFDVTLAWERRGLRFRLPLARDGFAQQGVLAQSPEFKREAARTEFFVGARESGMYVSVPAMLKSETEQAWGILLCPRVVSRIAASPKVQAGVELLRSPYELAEVRVSWQGHASASMPLGSKRERIRIDHSRSSGLPASTESHDEVTAVSPMITLDYQPTSPFSFVRYPQDGSFREGMVFAVEMQNPWGHRRIQRFSHAVYVQRFDEPSPVPVILGNMVVGRDEGVCYIVAGQRSLWSQYDKVDPVE